MTDELKPCPFCGGAARHLPAKIGFYSERAVCDSCCFWLPPAAWNRRTTQPAPITVQAGEVIDAARKLVKAKGRLHTEQNYKALANALAKHDAAIKAGGQGGEDGK